MLGFGYSLSIPSFSIALILIDAAIDLILKHNFIRQLAIATSLVVNKTDNKIYEVRGSSLLSARSLSDLTQKLFKSRSQEVFKYKPENSKIPQVFLTTSEHHWLQTEIERYLTKGNRN